MAKSTTMSIAGMLVAAATLFAATGTVLAYDAGDRLFRARIINVNPNDDSGPIVINGVPVAGSGVTVDDAYTLDLDFTWMLTPNWGVELLLDLSSSHDVSATGAALGGLGKIAEVNTLPPSLLLQYHFNPGAQIQPYVGFGINYTTFLDEEVSPSLNAALGGGASIDLDDSWGWAAQIGADIATGGDWFWNVDVKYINIETEAEIRAAAGLATVDVDINPTVIGIGVGRRF